MEIKLDPDDYTIGDAKEKKQSKFGGFFKKHLRFFHIKNFTIMLIAINVAFYILSNLINILDPRLDNIATELNSYKVRVIVNGREMYFPFNRDRVFNYAYASSFPPMIRHQGEAHRLLSATYQHAGLLHLAINMFSLFIIGRFFEAIYGKFRFFVIYTISGLASTLMSFFARYSFTLTTSVGASGSLFGLVGALLSFALINKGRLDPVYRKSLLSNLIFIIGINLFIGFSVGGIDNYGHVGGLIGGLAAAFVIQPLAFLKDKKEVKSMKVIFGITVAIVVVSIMMNFFYYFSGKSFTNLKQVFKKRASNIRNYNGRRENIPGRRMKRFNIPDNAEEI